MPQDVEAAWVPADGQMGKEVHVHSRILLGHRKEPNLICDNMNGPRGYNAKCNKSETNTYDFTGGI